MISGFKGIFLSRLRSMFTRKKKLTSLKSEEKCSSVEKLLFSSLVLGSKLEVGQRNALFSLNHLVKTDKDDNIFPRQNQTTGALAFRKNLC